MSSSPISPPSEPRREPRAFLAKRHGQCADSHQGCAGIKPGDLVVHLPVPAAFDRSPLSQRRSGELYFWLNYSHLECYQKSEAERAAREAEHKEREWQQSPSAG